MNTIDGLGQRIQAVRDKIADAARRAGRDPADVTLVAVTKTLPTAVCQAAVDTGLSDLGENYAQEFEQKTREVRGCNWHFIGPLQRNKVKLVVGRAALIHSVDRTSLLDEMAKQAHKLSLIQPCLIQVNIGREAQKAGCAIDDLASLLDHARGLTSLRIDGLMCIPPEGLPPQAFFVQLRQWCDEHQFKVCSMGMSGDFEAAIWAGATLIRIGTAIFGARR